MYWYAREKQRGVRLRRNSRFRTVVFRQCSANLSFKFRSSGMWCLRMWCLIIIVVTLSYKYMFPNRGSHNYYYQTPHPQTPHPLTPAFRQPLIQVFLGGSHGWTNSEWMRHSLGISVVFCKGLSLSRQMLTGNVQWLFTGSLQWNFTFASSGA